jgi:hypothetical protein
MPRNPSHELNLSPIKVAAYTALFSDDLVRVDTSAGAFAVTLPAAASVAGGKTISFISVGTGTNALTFTAFAGDAVRGAVVVNAQWEHCTLMSDGGVQWIVTEGLTA